jgi:hypothetical protein
MAEYRSPSPASTQPEWAVPCSSPFSRLALHGTLFPWGGPQQWPGLALAQMVTVTVPVARARGRLGGSPTTTTLKSGKASTEWPLSRPVAILLLSSQWAQLRASSGVIMITILAATPQLRGRRPRRICTMSSPHGLRARTAGWGTPSSLNQHDEQDQHRRI